MELKIEVLGADRIEEECGSLLPRRIQFAMLKAIDRTADKTKSRLYSEMHKIFDRPTPFILNSLRTKPPSMSDLSSEIGFKSDWVSRSPGILTPQVEAGARGFKAFEMALSRAGRLAGNEHLVPARGVPLNQYGNVSPGLIGRIIAGLRAQAGTRANTKAGSQTTWYFMSARGIGQRKGHETKWLFARKTGAPQYKKRFPFYEVASRFAAETYPAEFEKTLKEALEKQG